MEFRFFRLIWEPYAALVLGAVLTVGCLAALLRRDDVYDQGSARWMLLTNILGILTGVGLVYISISWILRYFGPDRM